MSREQKQVRITRILVVLLLAAAIGFTIFGIQVDHSFLRLISARTPDFFRRYAFAFVLILGYGCAAALLVMLVTMYRFLGRIETGLLFTEENVQALHRIASCCAAGAALTLAIGLIYYLPILIITAAAAFMMLIVRIIESAFARGLAMKSELDLTI